MTDFQKTRARFRIPEGVIYLDGNSLGPLPVAVEERVARTLADEWGGQLIRGWNSAGWMGQPGKVGDRIARLIGAPEGSVVVGDTLSIKVYQALAAALAMRPDRRVILSDSGNFPTDLYMAEGLIETLGRGHVLKVVAPEEVEAAIGEDVAVLMLTQVDYRTGRLHDMAALTAKAHAAGVVTVWDLAHSAGALPVDLAGAGADFAVGCTYKYLNGGPGAPAFIYVAPQHAETARPALSGWMGHEAPFAFDPSYRPGAGVERMRVGTPPVIALAALDAALDVWDDVDMADIRRASVALCDLFIELVEAQCPMLELASPREGNRRGSQVSFRHPQGYAIMQALIDRGVIGDFRAPDVLRFGFTPLYIGEAEVRGAVAILKQVMDGGLWDRPEYHKKAIVT
ncbi:kynureninase (plasmid) [Azospirillum oryzae]|uniref:Kynureninase n=1 Tax=Azospirillum oryzae TaxID=286727 RepID=A0A6N1ASU8_9PROT|nr:kynureninase [Azospirillum oryzae]KAA0584913.1 kynureninase [Azospirillum oryzae]QKS54393.1 kynureninase [Azospirillum oryzae]GLR78978.1 kynureninase [Azospirillum oryzae]